MGGHAGYATTLTSVIFYETISYIIITISNSICPYVFETTKQHCVSGYTIFGIVGSPLFLLYFDIFGILFWIPTSVSVFKIPRYRYWYSITDPALINERHLLNYQRLHEADIIISTTPQMFRQRKSRPKRGVPLCRKSWLKSWLKSAWNKHGYFDVIGSTVPKIGRAQAHFSGSGWSLWIFMSRACCT